MSDKNKKQKFYTILWIIILGAALVFSGRALWQWIAAPGEYDELATCISNSGAKFYGAFWCPHCQAQKKLFGKSASKLPYVECSTADDNGQLPICKENKIETYPTWILKDGTRLPVENSAGVTLKTLAEKTGCVLPVAN